MLSVYLGLTLAYVAAALPKVGNHAAVYIPARDVQSSSSSVLTSTVVIGDANLSLQTVVSTELPSTQTPTVTSASRGPQTSGSIITSLQTDGRPSLQPFPTSLPNITNSTLLPTDTTAPFDNATLTQPTSTRKQTITVPQSTVELVAVSSTVTALSVETTAVITSTSVFNTTDSQGSTTPSVGTIVVTSTGNVSTETTISAASTKTSTIASTITTAGSVSLAVAASATCVFSIGCDGQNMFLPIDVSEPPSIIEQKSGHPVARLGIENQTGPIETNKFYANFFLGDQSSPAFPMPYSLTWSKGSGNAESWGMAISHIASSQKVFGAVNTEIPNDPASYYINPLGIQSLIMSAAELGDDTVLTTDSPEVLSANVHLAPATGDSPVLTIPMVQGMAFVTGIYTNCQPEIESSVFFSSVGAVSITSSGISKYKATLDDDNVWLIYAIPDNGIAPNFRLVSSTTLQGISSWSGTIQIAKLPSGVSESIYDNAAGTYPTSGSISGYASGSTAQYSLSWSKGGPYADNTTLLMFALPHHVQSFTSTTQASITNLTLDTLTKGVGTAVSADYWVMEEQLPTDMGWMPWRPASSTSEVKTTITSDTLAVAQGIAAVEASQNMSAQTNLNSMYYSGKALSKFATLVFAMNNITEQQTLAASALAVLKESFDVFTSNVQQYPLVYDTDWKGVVSSASYVANDSGLDFGNSYYNDHHFHYGYFLHAASIVGYLDPTWLAANKDWVNALARDTSNPSSLDQYFPVFRSFDFYNGHSWAKGLFESGDGKDEESSSEDAMHAYGLKMWGQTVGDASMEARGNLMLAVLARSLQSYFLMESNNANQPANFIGNKVTGIMFENKVDHTTYFGSNFEYIQGIHMIPLMPFSTLTRTEEFVTQEWATYFADNASDPAWNVTGGWKGILYSNLAIINATAALDFFTQTDFDSSWLDGGASRTWYICQSALWG